jgi:hypothetical protein
MAAGVGPKMPLFDALDIDKPVQNLIMIVCKGLFLQILWQDKMSF